jgi:hypothetical protein
MARPGGNPHLVHRQVVPARESLDARANQVQGELAGVCQGCDLGETSTVQ